jgi:hypothetical protein
MTDPPLIAYLRTCSTDPNEDLAATMQGRSSAGLGVRPRVLAHNEDGSKVYGLSGKQVAKVLATYDAAVA